ncbi:hypothetical protein [Neisseria gonorrhoeae]|uniref:hypothetical protein n=1 Tax=Neisseria gonorrhoeae TaxID=485 RepID=UPI003014B223
MLGFDGVAGGVVFGDVVVVGGVVARNRLSAEPFYRTVFTPSGFRTSVSPITMALFTPVEAIVEIVGAHLISNFVT